MAERSHLQSMYLRSGIDHCRQGRWDMGLSELSHAFEHGIPRDPRRGVACSYYGYALARCRGDFVQGLNLCRQAARLEPAEPEVYFNLARLHLLAGRRSEAVKAREMGLQFDPEHAELLELRGQMQIRQPVILPFLPRSHRLNRCLGRLRHRLTVPSRHQMGTT